MFHPNLDILCSWWSVTFYNKLGSGNSSKTNLKHIVYILSFSFFTNHLSFLMCSQIRSIDRKQEVPHDGPMCDLLWSDPEGVVFYGTTTVSAIRMSIFIGHTLFYKKQCMFDQVYCFVQLQPQYREWTGESFY